MTRLPDGMAVPSREDIEKEAYARWERRGYVHGSDRDDWVAAELDLTFALNYRTLRRFEGGGGKPGIAGSPKPRRCRFCEQALSTSGPVHRPGRSPFPSFLDTSSTALIDICDECDEAFRENLEPGLRQFWNSLPLLIEHGAASPIPLLPFKALAWLALAILPESELEYFSDAIEWVSNPEHDEDSSLFSSISCLACSTAGGIAEPWAGIEKRRHEDSPLPAFLYLLSGGGVGLQFPIPLGVQDQESDGEERRLLRRSWSTGSGACRELAPTVGKPLRR